jgi:hypothetical protein
MDAFYEKQLLLAKRFRGFQAGLIDGVYSLEQTCSINKEILSSYLLRFSLDTTYEVTFAPALIRKKVDYLET